MEKENKAVLSLTNDGFKNYLVIRYLIEEVDAKWEYLKNIPDKDIPSQVWYNLYVQLQQDLREQGGTVTAFEKEGQELKSYNDLQGDNWPENWMWVIESVVEKD